MRIILVLAATATMACSNRPDIEPRAVAAASDKGFELKRSDDRVTVLLDGKPYTAFHFNTKWDKPFLFPLKTASGTVVSRGWPVEPRPGEQQDHAWHRGIWWGHGDISGEDFWREKGENASGKMVLLKEPEITKVNGSPAVRATLGLRTPKGDILGTVTEQYAFRRLADDVIIDATVVVSADRGKPLQFGDTDDGGFAFRLADEFRQDRGATLRNSEGLATTEKIWGKPAKWVDYSAKLDGKDVGVAVFDHPSNLRHPTTWHARGYSLAAANPFGLSSFTKTKANDGSYTLAAGDSLTFRYRVLIHEGEATAAEMNQVFDEFAASR